MIEFNLDTKFRTADYRVKFASYHDENKGKTLYVPKSVKREFGSEIRSDVCFARMKNEFISHTRKSSSPYENPKLDRVGLPIPNRVYYKAVKDDIATPELTESEKHKWIVMCKENKMLPDYVPLSTAKTEEVVFDLDNLTPSILYLYLSSVRNLTETPGFVRGMVRLVSKLQMNFFVAYVFLSNIFITNSGHHIINRSKSYGYNSKELNPEKMKKLSVDLMIGIRRMVNDPTKYDERPLFNRLGRCDWVAFSCNNNIERISKVTYEANAQELFNEHLVKAVMSETDLEAMEHISNLIREK